MGTWIAYGKNEEVSYHEGEYMPQDFAFVCNIRPIEPVYDTNRTYYVYFSPQMMNPLVSTTLSAKDSIPEGTNVTYEVSRDGKNWYELGESNNFTKNWSKPYKPSLFLRIGLKTNDENVTPYVDFVSILCQVNPALEAYIRTNFYAPENRQILGASCWSKIDARYTFDPGSIDSEGYDIPPIIDNEEQVSVKIDLVRDTPIIDRFILINYENIVDYLENKFIVASYLNLDLKTDENKVTSFIEEITIPLKNTDGEYDTSKIITWKDTDVAIKFYEYLNTLNVYYANDTASYSLSHDPAYPIIYCSFRPKTTDKTVILTDKDGVNLKNIFTGEDLKRNISYTREFSEFIDYNIDYDTSILSFTDEENNPVKLEPGNLLVEYYPCFIKNLNNKNLPLKLDLFTETFTYSNSNIFTLKVEPMDAIRRITVNEDTVTELSLVEDEDFTVNYKNKTIKFKPLSENSLNEGDTITIHYTPYLTDTGLSLVYRLKRYSENYQVNLDYNYLQYRI